MNNLPVWSVILIVIASVLMVLVAIFWYILITTLIKSTILKNKTIVKYLKPKLPAEQPETEEQKKDREATKTAIIFFVCMIASIALITFLAAYNNGCI